jgi:hypothetical protein
MASRQFLGSPPDLLPDFGRESMAGKGRSTALVCLRDAVFWPLSLDDRHLGPE